MAKLVHMEAAEHHDEVGRAAAMKRSAEARGCSTGAHAKSGASK